MNKKKIPCSIEIITPIHIGSGEDYYPTDYYFSDEDKKLIFFDKTAISRLILKEGENEFSEFVTAIERNDYFKMKRIMKPHIQKAKIREISVTDYVADETLSKGDKSASEHPISQHIKEAYNMLVYIPGSTVKGLIRTAFNYDFLKSDVQKKWVNTLKSKEKFEGDFLEIEGETRENDPFRCIKVSDFALVEGETLIDRALNFRKAEENMGSTENTIPDILELSCKGSLFYGEIDFSLFDKLETNGDNTFGRLIKKYFKEGSSAEIIISVLNRYYENLFLKEKKQFEKREINKIKNAAANILEIYQNWWKNGLDFNQSNSCYIKLGKHGGAISKTTAGGDDEFKDFRKIKIPQLNKILDCQLTNWVSSKGEPLGWAKITFLSEEEAEKLKEKRRRLIEEKAEENRKRKNALIEAELKKIKEEQEKIEREQREKEKAEKEAEKLANMSEFEKSLYLFEKEENGQKKGEKASHIYKMLDQLDGGEKIKAAEVLKKYYEDKGKWKGKMVKQQKENVKKIKGILGI